MARTRQRTLVFDSLEGKVLLSTGMADPAATVYQQKALPFHLNGKLEGLLSGTAGPDGFVVSSFSLKGHTASMGTVEGTFFLKYTFIRTGKLPNLSKASLYLVNPEGSVTIALNASGSHHYKFTIMSGSGKYTFASGQGKLTISETHNSPNFTITIKSKT
jgi:hypothetical protein